MTRMRTWPAATPGSVLPGVVSARAARGADDQHLRVANAACDARSVTRPVIVPVACAPAATHGAVNAAAATRIRRSVRSIVAPPPSFVRRSPDRLLTFRAPLIGAMNRADRRRDRLEQRLWDRPYPAVIDSRDVVPARTVGSGANPNERLTTGSANAVYWSECRHVSWPHPALTISAEDGMGSMPSKALKAKRPESGGTIGMDMQEESRLDGRRRSEDEMSADATASRRGTADLALSQVVTPRELSVPSSVIRSST